MLDHFSHSTGSAGSRKLESKETTKFSPSYGVRKGFIKDPNWPPAHFPEDGNATDRRFRRITCSFEVRNDEGDLIQTEGDISEGGARFTLKQPLVTDTVEVVSGGHKARAEIIATLTRQGSYTYRTRFLDSVEAAPVYSAIVARA